MKHQKSYDKGVKSSGTGKGPSILMNTEQKKAFAAGREAADRQRAEDERRRREADAAAARRK